MDNLRVYIGRLSPMHIGHETVIDTMQIDAKFNDDNVLIILGSANTQGTMRHMFSYSERRRFIRGVYPDISIVPLPDCPNDNDTWFQMLEDIIHLKGRLIKDCVFYAGCMEDVDILYDYVIERDASFVFCNRFDGRTSHVVSATQVREVLVKGQSLNKLVHHLIQDDVKSTFNKHWNNFQNR